MLNTHAIELIRSRIYAHVLHAMLVLSCCQRVSNRPVNLYYIEIYMKYNPMKHDMMYQYLYFETFATCKYILAQ